MPSDTDHPPPTTVPKFSRYRSVKQAAAASNAAAILQSTPQSPPPSIIPETTPAPEKNESIKKSMSRYRRARPVNTPATQPLATITSQQQPTPGENPFKTPPRSRGRRHMSSDADDELYTPPVPRAEKEPPQYVKQAGGNGETTPRKSVNKDRDQSFMEQRQAQIVQEHGFARNDNPMQYREENGPALGRTEKQMPPPKTAPLQTKVKPSKDNFWSFKRKSKEVLPTDLQFGGEVMVIPGIDAPVSAVNAGERRVLVRHKQSLVNLPVNPDTTAMDLIRTAANFFAHNIDPETSFLVEAYQLLGLERPLRKYEHVREVMNSWDRDAQTGLNLVDSSIRGQDDQLEVSCVPTDQPADTIVYLYHKQKGSKWSKRYITLRSDGQMLLAKKIDAKDKDMTSICHISDFDIYSPTAGQQSKVIKPPKKICYAIKSQQKSSMFLDTSSFVHYFCTDDTQLATQFYKAVQGWRSWYLVNKMGVGKKSRRHGAAGSHRQHESTSQSENSSIQYQIGSFQPFLPLDSFDATGTAEYHSPSRADPPSSAARARQMSVRQKMPPPNSFSKNSAKDRSGSVATHQSQTNRSDKLVQGISPQEIEDGTFAPTSLLGRTYSQRQKALAEKQAASSGPFMAGPTLLNGGPVNRGYDSSGESGRNVGRTLTIRSYRNSYDGSIERSLSSVRGKPKPLLNFDDHEYKEPPQHQRKGRGIALDQIPAGGLVDMATSPEVAIQIPSNNAWRRKDLGRANTVKATQRPHTSAAHGAVPFSPFSDAAEASDEEVFTGLLACSRPSQGPATRGRGVMNGAHAKGPMLDLNQHSKFVPGSLLAQVERSKPNNGPIIDREKWVEIDDVVGEK